ncbi:MAG: hypothetical protein KJO21_12950 [Verrucomicrobiae bacterium]|nr:hypothetical protein [Verrucomicrobiae bacterium]
MFAITFIKSCHCASLAFIVTLVSISSVGASPIAQYTLNTADIGEFASVGSGATTGQAGKFDQAYNFAGGANNLTTIPAGVVPSGSAERTISIWFNQTADQAGLQDKLFGYGAGTSGNAIDISLEDGSLRLRHFGGNITYGQNFDFDGTDAGWHHLAVRVGGGQA